tara:strand:+ start:263 stop:445 length:183 start_codon:yes stop_codon:yes gene_type:complete
MSKARLIGSIEVSINETLHRLSKIEGRDRESLHSEFKEWIDGIENRTRNYDVLYINKISD